MKSYGEEDVQIRVFLTSALVRAKWFALRPCRFTPGERSPTTRWRGVWMGPRAGLNDMEKLTLLTPWGLEFISSAIHPVT
jgi:hypothetical protein